MANEFIIKKGLISKANSVVSGSLIVTDGISGSFSGSFEGNGSGLTGLISSSFSTTSSYALTSISSSYAPIPPAFPFTGDAEITGSLIISGSFNSFIWDTSAIVLGEGAGTSLIKGANVSEETVIIGSNAANNLTYTDFNTVIGANAGRGLVAHQSSTFLGSDAGRAAAASKNTAVGAGAGYYASGQNNAYLGFFAGYGNSGNGNQEGNVAIGAESLRFIHTGDYNIGIGYKAGYNIGTGTGNIIIGSGSLCESAMSNQLRIGNGESVTVISGSLATGEILLNTTTISGSLLNIGTVSIDNTDSPYTITGTQQFILIDPSGGDVTVNMPDASTYPGRQIFFKLTQAAGANTVTLQRQGGDTIDGATTYTDLDIQYESISTVSDGGTGWFIF